MREADIKLPDTWLPQDGEAEDGSANVTVVSVMLPWRLIYNNNNNTPTIFAGAPTLLFLCQLLMYCEMKKN